MSEEKTTAAVLAVGTELTEGTTQDSHGRFLSGALTELGIATREILLLPDDRSLFVSTLSRLAESYEVVVITGGLGPTSDDLTREVVAECAGVELEYHVELMREIEERFAGRPLSATNSRQAYVPAGFTVIANPYGTAPAFWGRIGAAKGTFGRGAMVVALPGPPRELRPLVTEQVLGILRREFGKVEPEVLAGTTFLLGESRLEELLAEAREQGVSWGTRAEQYRVAIRLRGGDAARRERMFDALVAKVGPLRIRRGEVELPTLLLGTLAAQGLVMAIAESCTGGLVAKLLTDVPGASERLWGSFVVYSNEAKHRMLGVSEETIGRCGAVSQETVAEMTSGALENSSAGVSCAISGIAGPGGGSPGKPVGTVWIGVRRRGGSGWERRFQFAGDRDMVRRRSAVAALLLTERCLQGGEVDNDRDWQYI